MKLKKIRKFIIISVVICQSTVLFGQALNKLTVDKKVLDSLLIVNTTKNREIEKLNLELKKMQTELFTAKQSTSSIQQKNQECAEEKVKLAEQSKQYQNEINQLKLRIKELEVKLHIDQFNTDKNVASTSNIIKTIKIGTQVWMIDNLNVTTFRNGDKILEAQTDEEWEKAGKNKVPAWCSYDNDKKNDAKSGKLYNWYAVSDKRGLAPAGYHIPNETEWKTLVNQLGGEDIAALKMRFGPEWQDQTSVSHSKNNFSAVPTGWRKTSNDGIAFTSEGAYWWSATALSAKYAWTRYILYFSNNLKSYCYPKASGLAVRCIKD